jgi:hypothetical protein
VLLRVTVALAFAASAGVVALTVREAGDAEETPQRTNQLAEVGAR